jgi:hypothetical protein
MAVLYRRNSVLGWFRRVSVCRRRWGLSEKDSESREQWGVANAVERASNGIFSSRFLFNTSGFHVCLVWVGSTVLVCVAGAIAGKLAFSSRYPALIGRNAGSAVVLRGDGLRLVPLSTQVESSAQPNKPYGMRCRVTLDKPSWLWTPIFPLAALCLAGALLVLGGERDESRAMIVAGVVLSFPFGLWATRVPFLAAALHNSLLTGVRDGAGGVDGVVPVMDVIGGGKE